LPGSRGHENGRESQSARSHRRRPRSKSMRSCSASSASQRAVGKSELNPGAPEIRLSSASFSCRLDSSASRPLGSFVIEGIVPHGAKNNAALQRRDDGGAITITVPILSLPTDSFFPGGPMRFIIKAIRRDGRVTWLTSPRMSGQRAYGPRELAEKFETPSDAKAAVDQISVAETATTVFTIEPDKP
jgi:hypothetical protein